jgi:hypothetical protein
MLFFCYWMGIRYLSVKIPFPCFSFYISMYKYLIEASDRSILYFTDNYMDNWIPNTNAKPFIPKRLRTKATSEFSKRKCISKIFQVGFVRYSYIICNLQLIMLRYSTVSTCRFTEINILVWWLSPYEVCQWLTTDRWLSPYKVCQWFTTSRWLSPYKVCLIYNRSVVISI